MSSSLPLPLLLDPDLALPSVIIPEDEIYLPQPVMTQKAEDHASVASSCQRHSIRLP